MNAYQAAKTAQGINSGVNAAKGAVGEVLPGDQQAATATVADADEKALEQEAEAGKKKPEDTEVWEWVDDLLTGFAVIYSSTISAGHSCSDCVRKTAYPLKESIISGYDKTSAAMNPTVEARMGHGGLGGVTATFAHDEFE
mmetsp:Transcript_51198/g.81215  ORF Transcript_51198/g.81215 Transcript_51198/m.81215 type:complete len:141 (+) Transcript_51198:41-463(+)